MTLKEKIFSKNMWSTINLNFLKKLFFFISLTYFIYYFIASFQEIIFEIHLNNLKQNLLLSLIFCFLSIFFNGLAWKNIIIWFGNKSEIKNIVTFFIFTNSLKYVPGGIWHFVERFNFLKNNTNINLAFYGTLIEPYFMLSAALLLASLGVINNPLFLLFIAPSLFLHRNLIYYIVIQLEKLKNKSIKILKITKNKQEFNTGIKIRNWFPLRILMIEMTFILLKFISFILCFTTFNNIQDQSIIFLLVVFCLSWSIGLLIPAAPGGLGVFEACFLFLIGNKFSQDKVIISLVYFRFITTFADLFLSSPFLLKKIFKRI